MLTLLAFIVALSILVSVHEYGHFQVARWCGVKILKFSIGFGKPLWRRKTGRDQTEFIIAAIPLGGYVKMLDEREDEQEFGLQRHSPQDLARAFNRQPVIKRIAIVLAGPAANFLLAIFLYWLLFAMGTVGMKPIIGKVIERSPAAIASFSQGEIIQKINGQSVATWQDARWLLLKESLKGQRIEIQALGSNQETLLHQMNLSGLKQNSTGFDILDSLGIITYQPDIPARIGKIIKNSPADLAGLRTNDLVLTINHNDVHSWENFVQEIRQHPEDTLTILVQRESQEVKVVAKPEAVKEDGQTVGRIGATFSVDQSVLEPYLVTTDYSIAGALLKSAERTWDTSVFSLRILGKMILGQASWKNVSGPVTIASYAGQSAAMGIKVFIGFLAVISISIGVLNLLPIPVLDGGHFMYYVVELFSGKPVSESVMNIGQRVGFFLLGLMMILAIYNDLNRLIID